MACTFCISNLAPGSPKTFDPSHHLLSYAIVFAHPFSIHESKMGLEHTGSRTSSHGEDTYSSGPVYVPYYNPIAAFAEILSEIT